MSALPKKKVFMHGQWVEVTVVPPRVVPEPGLTAVPTGKHHLSAYDVTVYATDEVRRGRKRS